MIQPARFFRKPFNSVAIDISTHDFIANNVLFATTAMASSLIASGNSRFSKLLDNSIFKCQEEMIEGCKQGTVCDCRVIEVLADHGQCAHSQH